eukprot:892625-Pyramimonas_sp.AAC.2
MCTHAPRPRPRPGHASPGLLATSRCSCAGGPGARARASMLSCEPDLAGGGPARESSYDERDARES